MSSPDFGEVCFLIAFVIFVIATVVALLRTTVDTYVIPIIAAGLAMMALGWLAF